MEGAVAHVTILEGGIVRLSRISRMPSVIELKICQCVCILQNAKLAHAELLGLSTSILTFRESPATILCFVIASIFPFFVLLRTVDGDLCYLLSAI